VIGRGGMGTVYLGRDARGAPVALKMITPATVGSGRAVARFLREASILRQLDHPRIVRFHSIGQAGGQLFFAMDYVHGTDAYSLVKRRGSLTVGQAVRVMDNILDALAFAHARGFVHRDVKPPNVLIAGSGRRRTVKLADFGLARLYHNSPLSGLTLTGQIAGTIGFMAPELITDFRDAKPPADQYAAGATLYFLLTGQTVYDLPSTPQGQLLKILQDEPVPIRSRRGEIPEALATLIHRALARDPACRFSDVVALRAGLTPYLSVP
jgi:serine/threonine-protein kinase